MALNIKTALENVKEIYMSDSSLATLLDFERVLDELDLYAFKNWKLGELVEGPIYEKYFITVTFMWPYKKMPDPRGGEQLLNYNCEVTYRKDSLEYPIIPKSPKDFRPGTKMPKTTKTTVWLVSITMPKKLITEIQRGSLELENENLDIEDVEQAYEQGEDEEAIKSDQQGLGQEQVPGAAPQGVPYEQQPPPPPGF